MIDIALLVVRVLAAGALVAGFAILADMVKPRMFAGVFSGAPSVATVSLLVTGLAMGPAKDSMGAMNRGMVPQLDPGKIKTERFRDYAIRFAFGAVIALVAGLIGMALGPKAGGVFLAFPAILPASLTLISRKEGHEQAAVDSIGAVLGAIAMIVFAILVALTVVSWGVVPSVVSALVIWFAVAVGLYFLVATVYGREPTPP